MTKETPELRRMSRPLEETDPDIAAVLRNEVRRQATGLELIPSENFVSEAVLEAMGSVLTNKYAEGYPGETLLWRLRIRRSSRAARDRSRESALRSGPRQRAAAFRNASQHRRLHDRAPARRHCARNEPCTRRPLDARSSAEFFRQDIQIRALWRRERYGNNRLRRTRPSGAASISRK